jgi:hypothetical protein
MSEGRQCNNGEQEGVAIEERGKLIVEQTNSTVFMSRPRQFALIWAVVLSELVRPQ